MFRRSQERRQIIQAVQQVHERAFTASCTAQDGKGAPGRNGEADILEHRRLLLVGESDVIEYNVAVQRRLQCIGGILLLLRIQNISHPVDGNAGLAHLGKNPAQSSHRPGEGSVVGYQGQKFSHRNASVHRFHHTQYDYRENLQTSNQVAYTPIGAQQPAQPHP